MNSFKFSYNEKQDILYVYDNSKEVKFSADSQGLFIIDFDRANKAVGIEVLDASKAVYGLNKKLLKDLEQANMRSATKGNIISVLLTLKAKGHEAVSASIPISISR
ncbi:MAG: DUF2283 domain-containing protein [Candidatus Aenigmarchaeota archaeon]|nr:DUF2283 domain-containing protein [Candidatus Aenigmarchaeota archaeon]